MCLQEWKRVKDLLKVSEATGLATEFERLQQQKEVKEKQKTVSPPRILGGTI